MLFFGLKMKIGIGIILLGLVFLGIWFFFIVVVIGIKYFCVVGRVNLKEIFIVILVWIIGCIFFNLMIIGNEEIVFVCLLSLLMMVCKVMEGLLVRCIVV